MADQNPESIDQSFFRDLMDSVCRWRKEKKSRILYWVFGLSSVDANMGLCNAGRWILLVDGWMDGSLLDGSRSLTLQHTFEKLEKDQTGTPSVREDIQSKRNWVTCRNVPIAFSASAGLAFLLQDSHSAPATLWPPSPKKVMLRATSALFSKLPSMSSSLTFKPCKLALVQLAVTADKNANLANARAHVLQAANNGANVIVLPVRYQTFDLFSMAVVCMAVVYMIPFFLPFSQH